MNEWREENLGAACDLLNRGISPKYLEKGGVYVINQKCIRAHQISFEQARRHDIRSKAVNPERFIKIGDVLVNSTGTGTLGRVAQVRNEPLEPTTVDSHVTIVRPKQNKFFLDFFGYMMIAIEDEIKQAGEGCGGQTELARSVLSEKFKVKYPTSIDEQKRIVEILDESFAAADKAKDIVEQNLKNAKELFRCHLDVCFAEGKPGWNKSSLNEIADVEYGFTDNSIESGDYRYIRITDIDENGELTNFNKKYIKKSKDSEKFILKSNDLLMARTGATYGKVLFYKNFEISAFASYLIRINFKVKIQNELYWFFSKSKNYWTQVNGLVSGAAQPNFNGAALKKVNFTYPVNLTEQDALLLNLREAFEKCKLLENIYIKKIEKIDELKKSILRKAFSGELKGASQ